MRYENLLEVRMSSRPEITKTNAPAAISNPAAGQSSHSGRIEWALLILPGMIWGASYLFIAEGLEAFAPDGITFARFVIGFVTLSLVPGARQMPTRTVLAGLAVGLAGAVTMALPGLDAGGNSARGVLLVLAAIASY